MREFKKLNGNQETVEITHNNDKFIISEFPPDFEGDIEEDEQHDTERALYCTSVNIFQYNTQQIEFSRCRFYAKYWHYSEELCKH